MARSGASWGTVQICNQYGKVGEGGRGCHFSHLEEEVFDNWVWENREEEKVAVINSSRGRDGVKSFTWRIEFIRCSSYVSWMYFYKFTF